MVVVKCILLYIFNYVLLVLLLCESPPFQSDSQCDGFYRTYASVQLLSLLAALFTALVNALLKLSLRALTLAEAHSTFDNFHKSLVRKIFLASFANMAITALVAFGSARNVPTLLAKYGIFQGEFVRWYVDGILLIC